MKSESLKFVFEETKQKMDENRDYLLQLDSVFGDGDLGISMTEGFEGLCNFLESFEEEDLGKYFHRISNVFNECAPSSLGTIVSMLFMGMARFLKGSAEMDAMKSAQAICAGVSYLKTKVNSDVGQKTIMDAIIPGSEAFKNALEQGLGTQEALHKAYEEAKRGMEATAQMQAVHGRAAYHKEKTLGHIDGGAVVGMLLFQSMYEYVKNKNI